MKYASMKLNVTMSDVKIVFSVYDEKLWRVGASFSTNLPFDYIIIVYLHFSSVKLLILLLQTEFKSDKSEIK